MTIRHPNPKVFFTGRTQWILALLCAPALSSSAVAENSETAILLGEIITIDGGLIVSAGNMQNPIAENSAQLFMMLEFAGKTELLTAEQLDEHFASIDIDIASSCTHGFGSSSRGGCCFNHSDFDGDKRGRRGGPRGLESSSDTATGDFVLSRNSTGFSNAQAMQ